MSRRILLSSPDVDDSDRQALIRAFDSGWIAPLGPEVDAFEAELAAYCGRGHAVALASGTAALHLGLLTLGVQPGDVVLTSSMTFAATTNAVTYPGAQPVLVDADRTGSISVELLREAAADQRAQGKRIAAIVPVDLLGRVVDHDAIAEIADEFEVPVFSDAAESLGATLGGRPSASYGKAAVASFNGNKIITTSGGGAFLSDDKALCDRVRYLSTQARQPVIWYEHTDIGYNYRMSNLLAGLGRNQLAKLPEMMARRRATRAWYGELFAGVAGVELFGGTGEHGPGTYDNCWLTSIIVDPGEAGFTATELRIWLDERGIESRPLWKPMHLQPVYADAPAYVDGTGEWLFDNGLSLPSSSALTDADKDRIGAEITAFVESR